MGKILWFLILAVIITGCKKLKCDHEWKQGASCEQYKEYLQSAENIPYPVKVYKCKKCDKITTTHLGIYLESNYGKEKGREESKD